ncbi:hypothetical protein B0H63DRAFT_447723 [Podospora didyma]|uniref:Ecp2 effector protein domain-containing protein n=1 Tax=Podospora didyma TaxID=330526 RepID=A0AAE0NSE5_9PEZI|nr:hypothetical protein B0H63DRAFT_447723 [Podospora didyma]
MLASLKEFLTLSLGVLACLTNTALSSPAIVAKQDMLINSTFLRGAATTRSTASPNHNTTVAIHWELGDDSDQCYHYYYLDPDDIKTDVELLRSRGSDSVFLPFSTSTTIGVGYMGSVVCVTNAWILCWKSTSMAYRDIGDVVERIYKECGVGGGRITGYGGNGVSVYVKLGGMMMHCS